jgi:hypothetical protein
MGTQGFAQEIDKSCRAFPLPGPGERLAHRPKADVPGEGPNLLENVPHPARRLLMPHLLSFGRNLAMRSSDFLCNAGTEL